MKVCIAAGGDGTRMAPVTHWVNKHLIPVGTNELMLDLPLKFLRMHKIKEVTIVTGSKHASQIVDHVQDGVGHGFERVDYAFQNNSFGISDVLKRISHNGCDGGILLILGDNYFEKAQPMIDELSHSDMAVCWEYDVGDPDLARRFGQVIRNPEGTPVAIEEKSAYPMHGKILTGLYYFPSDVFEYVEQLTPSKRGELEITSLLDMYLQQGRLDVLSVNGEWADLGEYQSWGEFISKRYTQG